MYNLGIYSLIFVACWIAWLAYWFKFWHWTKKTKEQESSSQGFRYGILMILGIILIFSDTSHLPFLNRQVFNHSLTIILSGAVISIFGLFLLIYARKILADNWSNRGEIKHDHQLITHGPYKIIRNPIYAGLICLALGTALAAGFVAQILGALCILISSLIRVGQEEKLLSRHFGQQYAQYKSKSWALIPFIF